MPAVRFEAGRRLLSPAELADRWGVSRRTLRRWAVAGVLRPVRLSNGIVRFRLADVEALEHLAGDPS
jgi:excisionase family DNA binding protein